MDLFVGCFGVRDEDRVLFAYRGDDVAVGGHTAVGALHPATHALYDELYRGVYRRMYRQLQPLYKEIRRITGYPPA